MSAASLRSHAATGEAESPVFAVDLRSSVGIYGGQGEAESGVFTLDLRGVTGPTLPISRFGLSPEFSVNLLGLRGGLSLFGAVFDATTGQPVIGARVELGTQTTATDGQGRFAVSSLAVGEYALRASMAGYAEHHASVLVAPGSQVAPLVRLQPLASAGAAPRVSGIASRYSGFLYFLDGTPFFTDFGKLVEGEWGKNRNIQRLTSLVDDLVSKGRLDKRHFPKAGFGGIEVNLIPLVGGDETASARLRQPRWLCEVL